MPPEAEKVDMDVAHVAIWVSDLERSKGFYEGALGLEHEKDFVGPDGVVNYFVRGETDTFVQFKYDPEGDAKDGPGGMAHIALAVDDVDAAYDRVADRGDSTVEQEPTTIEDLDVRNAFVTDPDGYVLELEQSL